MSLTLLVGYARAETKWRMIDNGIAGQAVRAVVLRTHLPSTIFVGTASSGVFKSADSGRSWQAMINGLVGAQVTSFAVGPSVTDSIYVGTWTGGLHLSVDDGNTWIQHNIGLPSLKASTALAIRPDARSVVLLGIDAYGIYRSQNCGLTWSSSGGGRDIRCFAFNPLTPQVAYASSVYGVMKTTNGGDSWTTVGSGLPTSYTFGLAVNPANAVEVFVGTWQSGVYKSTNGGSTWSKSGTGLPAGATATALFMPPRSPGVIFAGTDGWGVYRSTDDGGTWTAFNVGLTNLTVNIGALVGNPDATAELYVGTEGGLFTTTCLHGQALTDCRPIATSGLLFAEHYTTDASGISEPPAPEPFFFDETRVQIVKNPGDRFYLSGRGSSLESFICDDKIYVYRADNDSSATEVCFSAIMNTLTCVPIDEALVGVPFKDITDLLDFGDHCVKFKLADTRREIHGNTPIYLIKYPNIVPVMLKRLSAERNGSGVMVRCELGDALLGVGLEVWRALPGQDRLRVGEMSGAGSTSRAFTDTAPPSGDADYWLRATVTGGEEKWYGPTHVEGVVVPAALHLTQNHPNPFNPRTKISYGLPQPGHVTLAIYDVRGSRVATLVDADLPVGERSAEWAGTNDRGNAMPSGVYFARLQTLAGVRTVKVTLAK